MGHRCEKIFTDKDGKVVSTLYVRDAQGNILSVYTYKGTVAEAETLSSGANSEIAWMQYLYKRSLEIGKNPGTSIVYLRDSILGRIPGFYQKYNEDNSFQVSVNNYFYAINAPNLTQEQLDAYQLDFYSSLRQIQDPDRQAFDENYFRRELGAIIQEFIYTRGFDATPTNTLTQRRTVTRELKQSEAHLYGSSRLGIDKINRRLLTQLVEEIFVPFNSTWVLLNKINPIVVEDNDSNYFCIRGRKRYEFSNHLGNVMVILSDKRV